VFNIKELNIFIPVASLPARSRLPTRPACPESPAGRSRFGEGRPRGILTG